jgi:two-component system, cell cycle sensor histidine kinase and response regulator CckA
MPGEHSRLLFDAHPCALLLVDADTLAICGVNDAAAKMYGRPRDEFIRLSLGDLAPLGEPSSIVLPAGTADGSRDIVRVAGRHELASGAVVQVEIAADLVTVEGRRAWLLAVADVTERRGLEEQLRQAQKMDAVGRLTSGVAHDFNNLLTAILGYSELALAKVGDGDPAHRYLEEVRKAGGRAAALTRRLLAFSRKQAARPTALDLNAVVKDMQPMLRRLIGEDIEIRIDLSPGLGRVLADPHQLEQVLMNLVVNARDAMPAGGVLTIRTANLSGAGAGAPGMPASWPSPLVVLSVGDTGCGMSDEVQARMFEPFFTTKEAGKGTGLGLSTVFDIVSQAGGALSVSSALGRGTTMTVRLPRSDDLPIDAPARPPGEPAVAGGRPATILVVDDDEALGQLAAMVLSEEGHAVLTAGTAEEACRLAESCPGGPDLILVDVVLPGTSGRALARWLETLYPAIRIVYMSGYDGPVLAGHGIVDEGPGFLQKPFGPGALLETIRSALAV